MVRGRRKCVRSEIKPETASNENMSCTAPKKRDSKLSKGVWGKLSHSSPQVPEACITRFFQPVKCNEAVKQEKDAPPFVTRTTRRRSPDLKVEEVLQPCDVVSLVEKNIVVKSEEPFLTNGISDIHSNDTEEKPFPAAESPQQTPHKIQLCPDVLTLSPSSALSQLRISTTPKKAVKSRRRLNPSQAVNQQAPKPLPFSGLKAAPISKPPVAENHKLTEYFPVRRSVRKTKRIVLEEWHRDLEDAVISGKEEGLEVHNFEGKGRGVVATRLFSKGEFVVEYAGELIDIAEAKQRERLYAQDQNTGCYMYYFKFRNNQYCVDATAESGHLGRLVNHSRNGNLSTKTILIKNKPHLVLIAKEEIHPGEEITYDYGDRSKESIRYHPWLLS